MKSLKLTDPETKYAIPPEGCEDYLTPGRKYEIIYFDFGAVNNGFKIKVDNGVVAYCLEECCLHLNGKDWIFSS